MTDSRTQRAQRPFAFLDRGRTGELLGTLAAEIAGDAEAQRILAMPARGVAHVADATLRVRPSGDVRLHDFYWSAQRSMPSGAPSFESRTLTYARSTREISWHSFPADPELPSASSVIERYPGARVLRYVPLRRLTLLTAGEYGTIIAKIKKPQRAVEAAQLLQSIGEALSGADISFDFARLVEIDPAAHLFTQTMCEGAALSSVMTAATAQELLADVGRIHAELNALPVDCLPARRVTTGEVRASAAAAASWIAALMPAHARRLATCAALIESNCPADEAEAFCHGDFACSQLLTRDGRWAIIDFELAHRGSRYRDIAIFLASLRSDVADFSHFNGSAVEHALAQAEAAYLEAYAQRSALPLDHGRLAWHRACAELHYLMLMLRKDRFVPADFEAGVERIEASCARAAKMRAAGSRSA